jgi:dUTP pyrophosphatase
MNIQAKIINPLINELNGIPKYQSSMAAGMDLIACIEEKVTIQPGETILIGTGLAIFINNPGYAALILPRSGLGHKNGIVLGNLVGLIDSDYQGELKISCWNRSSIAFTVEPGMRLAQLMIVPVVQAQLNFVEEFEATQRGESGFGSTGFTKQTIIEKNDAKQAIELD